MQFHHHLHCVPILFNSIIFVLFPQIDCPGPVMSTADLDIEGMHNDL